MIKIKSQSGTNQFDKNGNAITTWDGKKCAWIVNEEYEHEEIDWYGKDSDFPAGYTLSEYEVQFPTWDKNPDISVTWYWNDKETCIKAFGQPHTFLGLNHPNIFNYWDIQIYPYSVNKSWGYLDYKKEEVVEQLGKYCDFHKFADRTVVSYNGEILFDGKLYI